MKTTRLNTLIIFLLIVTATLLPFSQLEAQIVFTAGAGVTQTQNFNGITSATALPTGYTIGGGNTFTTATTLNGSSTGTAYKFASSTDYALGILNSGSYTSGKTITIALQNNTGATIQGFNISFNYEKYRSGSREWTFTLSGSSGTVSGGSITYPADAGNTQAYFPPQQTASTATITGLAVAPSGNYTLTWTLTGNGGSTNGQALAIDDLVITAIVPAVAATTMTGFGNVCINTTPSVKQFTITGTNLTTQNIQLANSTGGTIPGYTFSTDGVNYDPAPIILTQPGGSYSQTVYVKFTPVAILNYIANIYITGGGLGSSSTVTIPSTTRGVNSAPTVTIGTGNLINEADATLNGTIADIGCSPVIAYGIEYSITSGFATGTGIQVLSTNLSGSDFSTLLSSLLSSTGYYYRVFATNAGGTGYSAESSFGTPASLPVSWLYFTGTAKEKSNLLKWGTATEEKTLSFGLEKSVNGYDYQRIATIAASHNSTSERNYSFEDNSLNEISYYRIKQLDTDGNFTYSTTVRVNRQAISGSIMLYPVPVSGSLNVRWEGSYYKASVYNRLGVLVKEVALDGSERQLEIATASFTPDFYVLEMRTYEGDPVVKKFLVIE